MARFIAILIAASLLWGGCGDASKRQDAKNEVQPAQYDSASGSVSTAPPALAEARAALLVVKAVDIEGHGIPGATVRFRSAGGSEPTVCFSDYSGFCLFAPRGGRPYGLSVSLEGFRTTEVVDVQLAAAHVGYASVPMLVGEGRTRGEWTGKGGISYREVHATFLAAAERTLEWNRKLGLSHFDQSRSEREAMRPVERFSTPDPVLEDPGPVARGGVLLLASAEFEEEVPDGVAPQVVLRDEAGEALVGSAVTDDEPALLWVPSSALPRVRRIALEVPGRGQIGGIREVVLQPDHLHRIYVSEPGDPEEGLERWPQLVEDEEIDSVPLPR